MTALLVFETALPTRKSVTLLSRHGQHTSADDGVIAQNALECTDPVRAAPTRLGPHVGVRSSTGAGGPMSAQSTVPFGRRAHTLSSPHPMLVTFDPGLNGCRL